MEKYITRDEHEGSKNSGDIQCSPSPNAIKISFDCISSRKSSSSIGVPHPQSTMEIKFLPNLLFAALIRSLRVGFDFTIFFMVWSQLKILNHFMMVYILLLWLYLPKIPPSLESLTRTYLLLLIWQTMLRKKYL